MTDEIALIDTNILVYAFDRNQSRKKYERCKTLVKKAFRGEGKFAVSNQILAELYYVLTDKMAKPLSKSTAEVLVSGLAESSNWIRIDYRCLTLKRAMKLSRISKVSLWDSLIAATMLDNHIFTVYTENTKDFKKIKEIRTVNPI